MSLHPFLLLSVVVVTDPFLLACTVQSTLRIIEDRRPLVEDLISAAQELIDSCSPEGAQVVRNTVEMLTSKYDDAKVLTREKLHQLNDALRAAVTDVGAAVVIALVE